MRKSILLIALLYVLFSCNNTKENEIQSKDTSENKEEISVKNTSANNSIKDTYLCKVNGKDWGYTKASGVVSKNKNTGEKRASFTFKKKLDKGNESIMLDYDGDTFKLISASLILKFPKKGGGLVSGHYSLFPDTRSQNPESDMSGVIDLSNGSSASGNAELKKFNMKYEWDLLENPEYRVITVSDLKFEGVVYSDINKVLGLGKTKN
ncbi:hypothetical protein FBALC1_00832 [Flavobacteriales bacterium ALC-1]|nr:hypothetical protein FBALC1_00832 [Flavobacteriales bacterium ALC-1]